MEMFSLILALPLTFVASVLYCTGAAFVLFKLHRSRWIVVIASLSVILCIITEIVLIVEVGAKAAYFRYGLDFTIVHFVSVLLGPPAIANALLLMLSIPKAAWKISKILCATLLCWIACMSALLGNILVDEAIVGVKAGVPFYMTKP